jgi:uncharacterized protein with FMN-binding domain
MMKKKTAVILLIILAVIIAICAIIAYAVNGMDQNLDQLLDIEIEDADLSEVPDGTYPGSYKAPPIFVKVEVTVKDHAIADIEIIEHDNGKGAAAEAIIDEVVEKNSLHVDAVSGATYSSKVILLSIRDALLNAKA